MSGSASSGRQRGRAWPAGSGALHGALGFGSLRREANEDQRRRGSEGRRPGSQLDGRFEGAPGAKPEHLLRPGHIFPIMEQAGGVLTRPGHTEAGCDLARLAGLEPAVVTVEIMNEDGSMARRPDLHTFSAIHGIKIGTIADLITLRLASEPLIEFKAGNSG